MIYLTVDDKVKYLVFDSSESLKTFLNRKIIPVIKDNIEICRMEKFLGNRILFTAEHGMCKKINMEQYGEHAYIGVGDVNTDILARLGAYYLRSAYLIPQFIRTDADASRPPEELNKGLRLFVKIFYSKSHTSTYIPIHTNKNYLPYLDRYHQMIEELDPRAIISIHGMHKKRNFDLLFGFGEDYAAIDGKKNAFEFKNRFIYFLDKVFSSVGLKNNLEIAVSTWRFTGTSNYVLTKHVIEHNKQSKNKRIGMHVEFNWKGRVKEDDGKIPSPPYQVVVQALGDFVFQWLKERKLI